MIKSRKKFVPAGLALLTIVLLLPLAGCKNDTVPESTKQETPKHTVRKLTAITVTPPTRTVYSVGDSFDSTGMKVTATYDGTISRDVTESATTDFATVASGKGIGKPVTVSYKEGDTTQTATFPVDVASYKFTEEVEAYEYPSGQTGTASPQSKPAVSNPIYKKFGDWPQTVRAVGIDIGTGTLVRGGLTYHVGSDGNYYVKQGDKYYKVEPIVWRVLTENYNSTGTALLLAESILTGGIPYYVDFVQRTITGAGTDGGDTVYLNHYQYSTVRAWLNGKYESDDTQSQTYTNTGFLQSAFTADAQALIASTTVDNSAASTNPASNSTQWNSGTNGYACANTTDKVFLLSEKESTTSGYGFAAYNVYKGDTNGTTSSTRIRVPTDYAKATGSNQDSSAGNGGWWWLRSPHYEGDNFVRDVNHGGNADDGEMVVAVAGGVVPALCVQL